MNFKEIRSGETIHRRRRDAGKSRTTMIADDYIIPIRVKKRASLSPYPFLPYRK